MHPEFRRADLKNEADRNNVLSLIEGFSDNSTFPRKMEDTTRQTLMNNLRNFPTTVIFIAGEEEKAIGIAVCFLLFSTFKNAPVLNLHDLYIRNDYQGKGIGKQFMEFIEEQARSAGWCRIMLEVYDSNERAKWLYEKLGYGGSERDDPSHVMYAMSKDL